MNETTIEDILKAIDKLNRQRADEIRPRVLDAAGVARKFGKASATWFYGRRRKLEDQRDFPKKDMLLGGWSEASIDLWFQHDAEANSTLFEKIVRERTVENQDDEDEWAKWNPK